MFWKGPCPVIFYGEETQPEPILQRICCCWHSIRVSENPVFWNFLFLPFQPEREHWTLLHLHQHLTHHASSMTIFVSTSCSNNLLPNMAPQQTPASWCISHIMPHQWAFLCRQIATTTCFQNVEPQQTLASWCISQLMPHQWPFSCQQILGEHFGPEKIFSPPPNIPNSPQTPSRPLSPSPSEENFPPLWDKSLPRPLPAASDSPFLLRD